jgi:hypothetical protein
MKSVADLIAYVRANSRNVSMWKQLVNLWSQATQLYCEKVALAKSDPNNPRTSFSSSKNGIYTIPEYSIRFERFLEAADNLLQKRIGANFTLNVKREFLFLFIV